MQSVLLNLQEEEAMKKMPVAAQAELERPKDSFFRRLNERDEAVVFEEVKLRTGHSTVAPAEVDLSSRFSRHVPLKAPFASAAMDTVTEYPMAIAMAVLGGIGVIHRNLDMNTQARQVARVKHRFHRCIDKPICVSESNTVGEVLAWREEEDFPFESFLVLGEHGQLVGVITGRDFERSDADMRVRDAMTPKSELVTAPPDTTLEIAYRLFRWDARRVNLLPLVNDAGTVAGLYVFSDVRRWMLGEADAFNTDSHGRLRVAAAIGVGEHELERAEALVRKEVDALVVDTAHGDTANMQWMLAKLKQRYPSVDIVAGNVSEPESAQRLAEWGADAVKVGQGPGSICTTRNETGIGSPQLSAVANCEHAVRRYGIPVIADGGISQPGHVALALAAGAESVMMGRMFAGTEEAPGNILLVRDRAYKLYRGMGSLAAMQASSASRERYGQSKAGGAPVSEGVEELEPFKGSVATILAKLAGELKSSLGYQGAPTIHSLQSHARFLRHSAAGARESSPHGINEIPERLPGS